MKDLSQVGRDLKETIIIDNSPTSYIFHPQHAVPISSWFSDAHDNELLDLIPVLEDLAGPIVQDVSLVLDVTLMPCKPTAGIYSFTSFIYVQQPNHVMALRLVMARMAFRSILLQSTA